MWVLAPYFSAKNKKKFVDFLIKRKLLYYVKTNPSQKKNHVNRFLPEGWLEPPELERQTSFHQLPVLPRASGLGFSYCLDYVIHK